MCHTIIYAMSKKGAFILRMLLINSPTDPARMVSNNDL